MPRFSETLFGPRAEPSLDPALFTASDETPVWQVWAMVLVLAAAIVLLVLIPANIYQANHSGNQRPNIQGVSK